MTLTDLNLVNAKAIHPGNKARECCFPCTADSDKQQMALWLPEYPKKY